MELKIDELVNNAHDKISEALNDTEYEKYINEILEDYILFIKISIEKGLIKNNDDLKLFFINNVKYFEGTAYASWCKHELTLQKRFFIERNKEERRNVLFHELIHSLMKKLFGYDNENYINFVHYIKQVAKNLTPDEYDIIKQKYKDIFDSKYYEDRSHVICGVSIDI